MSKAKGDPAGENANVSGMVVPKRLFNRVLTLPPRDWNIAVKLKSVAEEMEAYRTLLTIFLVERIEVLPIKRMESKGIRRPRPIKASTVLGWLTKAEMIYTRDKSIIGTVKGVMVILAFFLIKLWTDQEMATIVVAMITSKYLLGS